MGHALFLALRSLWWYRGRSLMIILCLALTLWLPVTVRQLLNQFRSEITARADATPLVVGASGSRIDLILHALYFESAPTAVTTMKEVDLIRDSGLALAIPMHAAFRTERRSGRPGVPIVGTVPEYAEFRHLVPAEGRMFSMLGECVVGADAAEQLHLKSGDTILSAPQNAFDLAGDYPLKMKVTGILRRTRSADDHVVFTDIKTVWIIQGIGHGHQDLNASDDQNLVMARENGGVTGSAAVLPYTEITEDNQDSFHFHGDADTFPATAVIAVPDSDRSRTLLLGRYVSAQKTLQCLSPPNVVGELLTIVFRVERVFRVSSLIAGVVTILLTGLVMSLSIRLRSEEFRTMFFLGCSRGTVVRLAATELLVLFVMSSLMAAAAAWLTSVMAADILRQLIF